MSKKPNLPRHKRAKMAFTFEGGDIETKDLSEITESLIIQFARMAISDDPMLRAQGLERIKMVAELCIAGQFYLADQAPKSKKSRSTVESDEGRTSVTEIIKGLASKKDSLGDYLKPSELWGEYVSVLDELGLCPKEDKLEVTFEGGKTTKDSFRATLSRIRKHTRVD
ncbi:hypothetical protein SAMN05216189_104722 [Pseudomonas delhiensis]|uniref:Uncharacterized protein n=1 Tax=Pseudomonas delhiensis TaxID=366289 RepID=A0A239ND46_9PSED|nr:hypothetical protein [Pseudomonas delhiensis]SDK68256.1 hypothetical protein SAMN05216189_104722 [Pseudomonas delhiensis]SNT52680.1 hypothetical protein SAMN06295949_14222 [Pseudomonas delhiensis]